MRLRDEGDEGDDQRGADDTVERQEPAIAQPPRRERGDDPQDEKHRSPPRRRLMNVQERAEETRLRERVHEEMNPVEV